MTRLLTLAGIVVLTLFASCGARSAEPPGAPRGARLRVIAFDNTYGRIAALRVYVTVDGGAEQSSTATCQAKTCTAAIPLTNGSHTLTLSVEQEGKRSEVTTITVDTTADAKR